MERLKSLGWSSDWASVWESTLAGQVRHTAEGGEAFLPARVVEEHRGACRVVGETGEWFAQVSGRLRYLAAGPEDLPAVGDWVVLSPPQGEGRATLHQVLPRRTVLVRKAPERPTASQVLAANVDAVFLVTSINRDFSPRRIERGVVLAREGGALPVVLLSKCDLAEDVEACCAAAEAAAPGVPVHAVSAVSGLGLEGLATHLGFGRTAVMLGSSGVGKSTLVNRLAGREVLATQDVRGADDKGRHTTSHRQIVILEQGGVLIDTPGLREVGLWGDEGGSVESAFPDVEALLGTCRFGDCGHSNEPGCAVREAIERGEISPERFESYEALAREAERLRLKRDARGRHEERKKGKRFAKTLRERLDKRGPR